MNQDIENIILKLLDANKVIKINLIQNLWSGYGELTRVTTDKGAVILKFIQFPTERDHPRGWTSDISHERKRTSYQVEKNWYENLVPVNGARMAASIATGITGAHEYILLEDLSTSGFTSRNYVDWPEVEHCLSWLAHFHRHYLDQQPPGLWPIGTYWHLDTRPEELEALTDTELKKAAPRIDQALNQARYQTVVHGDAKLANFLFNGHQAAAVDFQYVGGGVGIKDVAYFLSSIYEEDELEAHETRCLDTYFNYLDLPDVEEEWRALYPLAWCDFYRFLQGWSPGHWKIHGYSERMKEKALRCI
jgi:hypothetical protein